MTDQRALTVTEAMTRARQALEGVAVRVVGEVSEFNDKPGYKAAYFTVCDDGAVMPAMMWRDAYRASGVRLACGMLVEMEGRFSAYIPKGRMQFIVQRLSPAGEGTLRMQVAALARRLEDEGLMCPDRKRPVPAYPTRIGVVTSPRGKAVHDVLRTLRRRYPMAEVLVAGVTVEGAGAPRAIVDGLKAAVDGGAEVIVLVRGGGSYEDLMPFNHELVARTLAACPVPVVTGIGHEPDTSIADMVADVRASTPTAAAETVAPSVEEMASRIERGSRSLARALAHRLHDAESRVRLVARRPVWSDPTVLLAPSWQALDLHRASLRRVLPARLDRETQRSDYLRERLVRSGPEIDRRMRERVGRQAARLDDLSPQRVLDRGYAVCYAADGTTVVRSAEEVGTDERVAVRLARGSIGCTVDTIEPEG